MRKSTRARLIEAALEVFGERGYHHATIQQIVRRAGTNVAAINYHFGDKAQFYGEVVSYALNLPRNAIREGTRVRVKTAGNQLDVRPVEIVLSRKDTVLISRGLRDGEAIITSQVPAAIPGLPLQTVDESPSPVKASSESDDPGRATTVSTE